MEKITRKSVLTKAMGMAGFEDEEREVLQKMIASLDRKSSSKKETDRQRENKAIAQEIIEYLATVNKAQAKVIGQNVGTKDLTSQRVLGIIKSTGIADQINKTTEKGVTYFSLAEDNTEAE